MYFAVMGINYKTAPVDVRERFAFPESDISHALSLLKAKEEIMECIIISTCNRVEIYSLMKELKTNVLKDFLRDYHKFSGDLDKYLYFKKDEEAVTHLCKLSAGLDSMVIGEPQIFGQVKEAYKMALDCKTAGVIFKNIFSQAFSVVKKVRSKTGIGRSNVSVSHAAVTLANNIFTDMGGKSVLILGAGEMGELTVRALINNGVTDVLVATRTFQKAVKLAEEFHGTPIMMYEIFEYIPKVDILISSIGAPNYVLTYDNMKEIKNLRKNKPIFLIDIAVPRSIDPSISDIEGIHLYNIDDLKAVVESSTELRKKEAEKAERIINSKVKEIMEKFNSQDVMPTFLYIRSKAEEIRKQGLDETIDKLHISDEDKAVIESLTESIVNKILHHTMIKLREYSNNIKNNLFF